ncbi:MAG: sigma-70 family RNA polymerase sigma factor [Candidatus Buchananbacteria bacterium]
MNEFNQQNISPANPSDANLIGLALANNDEALKVLFARYLNLVYSVIRNYVQEPEEADDLSQEVFIKVWRNLNKFNLEKKFSTWIFEIAKNTALDYLKKKRAIPFSNFESLEGKNWLMESLADDSYHPLETADTKILTAQIQEAVNQLNQSYQETLSLYHQRELTFQEISTIKNESINTVKSRYRRAVNQIKKSLKV